MSRIKIRLTNQPRLMALTADDVFAGYQVIESTPGAPNAVVEVPDNFPPDAIDALVRDWQRRGLVEPSADNGLLWRREFEDYTVLGFPSPVGPLANVAVGDTFPLMGVTEAVRRRGKYGAGVAILHLDTGLDRNHVAFRDTTFARVEPDDHGHGTHTASTCGSAWGIASDAVMYSMNVLPGGTGSESGIAAGIRQATDWAVSQRVAAVLSMSLGGSASSIMDDACTYARQRGVVVVSAAGNTANAAIGSPARASDLIVLAVTRSRDYASFTSGVNWTDRPNRVAAPGVDILAAARNTADDTLPMSGTSMATPHVAGCVALLLAAGISPKEVGHALLA